MTQPLLEISNLDVVFQGRQAPRQVLHGVSLALAPGKILGVVGESGSGKSVTGFSVMGLLPAQARVMGGTIRFRGQDITNNTPRALRGAAIAMIFQNPRAALNPTRRIYDQVGDILRAHQTLDRATLRQRIVAALEAVQFPDVARRMNCYPHELSGGLCQRVMIAMAIACNPQLIIADEPTTGLDVLTQKAVMDLLFRLTRERGMSLVLITHDLGLAAQYCDQVLVMQKGKVVETGPADRLFSAPQHPYTRSLVAACPTELEDSALDEAPATARPVLLDVRNLIKRYGNGHLAVNNVSFRIEAGESIGLIGESGSGKSSLSRLVCRLLDPDSGNIIFDGVDIGAVKSREFYKAPQRRDIQLVFQDAVGSLNPRFSVFASIADPLRRFDPGKSPDELRSMVENCARQAGLSADLLDRYPHQLSGGQCARVGIARAISVEPRLLVLDEPTAALDVLVQEEILLLLEHLREARGMSYLFVSHDLNVVRRLCNRMLILQRGTIVEEGECERIFQNPQSPYTAALLDAIPHFRRVSNPVS